jgi:hypothetical protein
LPTLLTNLATLDFVANLRLPGLANLADDVAALLARHLAAVLDDDLLRHVLAHLTLHLEAIL